MRKLACLVILFVSATLATFADVKKGTGVYFMFNDLKYEVLDEDAHTAAVAVQGADCPTYARIYGTISITDDNGVDRDYTVVQINPEAFMGNKDLFKVKFASTITDIGDRAFKDCEIVNFDELPEQLETIGKEAFNGCNSVKRIKLPESTTVLGYRCFAEMASLKRAVLFSKVQEIPMQAFISCEQLEEVYLPEELTKINEDAFAWCISLNEITFPATLEKIGDHAFIGGAPSREGLKHFVLPASVNNFGKAFRHSGIQSADLSDLEIEEIPSGAFEACYELRQIKLPSRLRTIGEAAFVLCGGNQGRILNDVVLPKTVETISKHAFAGTTILSLTIGDNVKELPLESCGTPKILHLGSGIKTIDANAIDFSCLSIITIDASIPPTVTGDFPLTSEQKRKIAVIVIDEDAKELYEGHEYWKDFYIATAENSEVTVHLDGSTDIATAIHTKSGLMPAAVTKLKVSGHLTNADMLLIKENMLSLIYLDMSDVDNTIIPEAAFKGKLTLETVLLPQNLKRVESEAFQGCSSMRIDELPNSIEFIGNSAFNGCERITVSRMPDALRVLEGEAFQDCVSITSLIFGENLEEMGGGAFRWCENIEYVDLSRSTKLKELPGQAFIVAYNMHTLLLPEGLERLCGECISETAIKSLDLPGSLKSLEENALCSTNLRVLTFGEGITEIPDRALSGNRKLLTVNFPSTLTALHPGSFIDSKNIAGISCLAIEAPEASSATFEDVNTRTCILSVPVPSFYSYLSTPGWGMFSNISNTLEVDIPDDVTVTTITEEDYQDLEEEEGSQEREQGNGEDENEEDQQGDKTTPQNAMKKLISQKQREVSNSLLGGQLFCKLSHGTVLASESDEESKGHRVFIHAKNGQSISSVKVNGVEMVDKLDKHNSFVLRAGIFGKLVINGGNQASIENVWADETNAETICDVYSLSGQRLYTGRMGSIKDVLASGIYVVKPQNNGHAIKMVVK